MCVAVPVRLLEANGNQGKVETGGTVITVGLDLVDDVKPGDYLIVHGGFAMEKLNLEEARKRLELYNQLIKKDSADA